MLAFLKALFGRTGCEIEARCKVNRIRTLIGPERIDGLVIKVNRGLAYVAWPNGDTTVESIEHLVPIIA